MSSHLVRGPLTLKALREGAIGAPKNGLKVFSCFHCGGGSTMGYKLAGFDVLGGVEIDPEMMAIYRANHQPRHSYLMGVQDFKNEPDLPAELFDLDVLDGSPPCSSFSIAGSREDAWGEKKKFREGQADQVLDDLFFHFIDIANRLRPKVVVAENVKGLILGNARGYVKEIFAAFVKAGYESQLFLLNSSVMGVPQRRERTFFVARRADLALAPLELEFNEPIMSVGAALKGVQHVEPKPATPLATGFWMKLRPGWQFSSVHPKGSWFNRMKLDPSDAAPTVTGHAGTDLYHWKKPRHLSAEEIVRLQSFPDDFDFMKARGGYVCGMSVPPFMMQRVADQIAKQWFA